MRKRTRTFSLEGLFIQEKNLDENDYINTFNGAFKKQDFDEENLFEINLFGSQNVCKY
jgi:hypothetical protein